MTAVLLCVFSFSAGFAQVEIPAIVDPVTDVTNTLDKVEYTNLRKQIIQFEDSTSNQIVVLMISTLGEYEIRDFGIRTLEKNKIGQKGKDNGILLLIAKDDRKVAIEVGYGLEGVLTDALCDQIIRREILPEFRDGNYYQGISAGIASMMTATKGEYMAEKKNNGGKSDWFGVLIIAFVILFSILTGFRRRRFGITSQGTNNIWWGGSGFGSRGGFGSFGGGGGGGGWSAGGGSFGGGGASGSW